MEQNMEDLQYCEIREWLIKKAKHYLDFAQTSGEKI